MKKYLLIIVLAFLSKSTFGQAYVAGPSNCYTGTSYTFTTENNTEPIKYWSLYGPTGARDTTTTGNSITLTFTEPGTYYLVCGYDLEITVTTPTASNLIVAPCPKLSCPPIPDVLKSTSPICFVKQNLADSYFTLLNTYNLTSVVVNNKNFKLQTL